MKKYLISLLTIFSLISPIRSEAFQFLALDELQTEQFDTRLSTNWLKEVKAVLPSTYGDNRNFDFHTATNCLAQETKQGNLAAQGLWGMSIVVQSQSRDATDAGLQLLRDAAEKGNILAMLNLGYLFEGGQYVLRNYNEAFRWFNQAADKGAAEGQLEIGNCYRYGFSVTPNLSQAAKYYQLAAAQTNFAAMKSLGYLLMTGFGVEKDEEKAKYWLLRAAEEGNNRRAMYDLGALYCQKFPDAGSMAEAFKWIKKSADLGDPIAASDLSNFYLHGWGATETNVDTYRSWLVKAATLGATDAQYSLGRAYRTGDVMPTNMELSLAWIKRAAEKNHPDALYDLAVYYLGNKTNDGSLRLGHELMLRGAKMGNREAQFQYAMSCFRGDSVVDCDGGEEWLEKAAKNGWAKAEFLSFQLYYNGFPPAKDCSPYRKDKSEAIEWLHRAVDHGCLPAQSVLAVMLIRGLDMDPNKTEAEKLLRDAAEHGLSQAQNDLGFAILHGDFASTNFVEAAVWCKLAASDFANPNVANRAAVNLSAAMKRLTYDQQNEVDDRADKFRPLPLAVDDPKVKDWQANPDYQAEDGRLNQLVH